MNKKTIFKFINFNHVIKFSVQMNKLKMICKRIESVLNKFHKYSHKMRYPDMNDGIINNNWKARKLSHYMKQVITVFDE